MKKYYRKRKSKNDARLFFALVAFFTVLSLINKVIEFLANHLFIVIILSTLALSIALILLLNKLINSIYKKRILEHEPSIALLKRLNENFNFTHVENFVFDNYYDNENFFDDISEKDYLTYELVYFKKKVLTAIEAARKNALIYDKYSPKVAELQKQFPEYNFILDLIVNI